MQQMIGDKKIVMHKRAYHAIFLLILAGKFGMKPE